MNAAFRLVVFPAIAQEDETYRYRSPFGWRTHVRAPGEALHEAREPLSVLEVQRKLLGTQHFSAQYLQMPSAPGGNLIKLEWFPRFDLSLPPKFDLILQSWDSASKAHKGADHSVCVTFGMIGGHVFLLNVYRARLEYPDLKRAVRERQAMFGAHIVLIEDCASGIALIQELRSEGMAGLREMTPLKDKVTRLDVHTASLEAGFMHLPLQAPWLDDYLHELSLFPKGKYDDQVDATSQALAYIFVRVGPDAWLREAYEDSARKQERDIPTYRVNHPELSRQFYLINGRVPRREADGSFLVTGEELGPLRRVAGIIITEPR